MRVCSGARLILAYAMTESSLAGLINTIGFKMNGPNDLGFVCSLAEAKVVDVSNKCEFSLEQGYGELHIKSPGIALGYVDGEWGRIKPIADADGFYATGDLVNLNKNGSVNFIRRVSFVVKMKSGNYVDVEAVESALE